MKFGFKIFECVSRFSRIPMWSHRDFKRLVDTTACIPTLKQTIAW